jgi:hypothetical protein
MQDLGQNKLYYIVNTLTSGESGISATINSSPWTLLKLEEGSNIPTGTTVSELTLEEFKACLSLNAFDTTTTGARIYKKMDEIFSKDLLISFTSDTGSLSKANTDTLRTLLSGVLGYIQIYSPHHARTELNSITPTALFTQGTKDIYLSYLDAHLSKYPREEF